MRSFQEGKQLIVDVTPEDIGQLDPRVSEVRDELFGDGDVPQGASNVINTLGNKDAAPAAIAPAVSAAVDQARVAAPGSLFPTPQPVQTAQTSVNDGLDFPPMPLPVEKPELERIGEPVDRLAPADIPQSKPSEEDLQAEVGKEPEPVEAVVVNAQPVRREKPEPAPETDVAHVAEVIPETDLIAEVVNAGGQTSIPVTLASEQDESAGAFRLMLLMLKMGCRLRAVLLLNQLFRKRTTLQRVLLVLRRIVLVIPFVWCFRLSTRLVLLFSAEMKRFGRCSTVRSIWTGAVFQPF